MAAIIGQLLLGWLLADFVTGVFHWWEDQFGKATWPIVGPWLIAPNRLHHTDPLAFTRHGFLERNGASIVAASIALDLLVFIFGLSPGLVAFALGGALSNEVHRYAHQPSAAPGWVRVLQEIGLFQSPKMHSGHHRPPQSANYCVLTDWLNPLLEALRFFERAELLFRRDGHVGEGER
jgi:sterol desaturase/sphingolipid hydroxylase (fatty acid hydroxylase superfamily)